VRFAPARLTPKRVVTKKSASLMFAPARLTPVRFATENLALLRFAPARFAPARFVDTNSIPEKSQPRRSASGAGTHVEVIVVVVMAVSTGELQANNPQSATLTPSFLKFIAVAINPTMVCVDVSQKGSSDL